MFEEPGYGILNCLEGVGVGRFKGNGFLPRAGHIARTERLTQHTLAVDITVRPERAIAFENVAAPRAVRAGFCVPPPIHGSL